MDPDPGHVCGGFPVSDMPRCLLVPSPYGICIALPYSPRVDGFLFSYGVYSSSSRLATSFLRPKVEVSQGGIRLET